MAETDWREIISLSQQELSEADKEKLCESLSWMEADDIELNFGDLKILFRLAQDILKYKSEQVNNLLGELQILKSSVKKKKGKSTSVKAQRSPSKSDVTSQETIAHQEEIINTNKEIIKQLYEEITALEGRKSRLQDDSNVDRESDSSRDALSEIHAIQELENQVAMKNKHIRKLISDSKVLEEQNVDLKKTTSDLKDKLAEATQVLENLTEQLLEINTENKHLKELLGKTEEERSTYTFDVKLLKNKLIEVETEKNVLYEDLQAKIQHWKNVAKSRKEEIDKLLSENNRLKDELEQNQASSPKNDNDTAAQRSINTLQEKLTEATNEIIQSARLIENLRKENQQLKAAINDKCPDTPMSDMRNESDDGKQRALIRKLKNDIETLKLALKGSEEMVENREKEISQVSGQLMLVQSGDDGLNSLIENLKSKKNLIKRKDETIKSLVQDVNKLNDAVEKLQIENETLRDQLNIPAHENISIGGTLKKYKDTEHKLELMRKEIHLMEEKVTKEELESYGYKSALLKIQSYLKHKGFDMDEINKICNTQSSPSEAYKGNPVKGSSKDICISKKEMDEIIEENAGLRKGLQEVLDYLKDNSTTSSGILALECPSIETVITHMEARQAAGWFSPHMSVMMELKTALGGRDALLTALHEARKQTFDVMTKLSQESEKAQKLTEQLQKVETSTTDENVNDGATTLIGDPEIGAWMMEAQKFDIDVTKSEQIEDMLSSLNISHYNQLKKVLVYFHKKFVSLFEQITQLSVQSSDDQNQWILKEEQYKTEIEQLKIILQSKADEDVSEDSPGLINCFHETSVVNRKINYLEDSYKYVRTMNENLRNEFFEKQKELLTIKGDYEIKLQSMMLALTNLTDKLRNSVPVELLLDQNKAFDDVVVKYRNILNKDVALNIHKTTQNKNLQQEIQNANIDKQKQLSDPEISQQKVILQEVETNVLHKQIERLCSELELKEQQIDVLEKYNIKLQDDQMKIINVNVNTAVQEKNYEERVVELESRNKTLKERLTAVNKELETKILELQQIQQRQMNQDIEVNMLRHQVLDLQSESDNKAALARLSGEVLMAHLQASESHTKIESLVSELHNEIAKRLETEEILKTREKIFNVYAHKYQSKFKHLTEILQVLKLQYVGSLPICSLETFRNNAEDLARMTSAAQDKLNEIEDLRSDLMNKHNAYESVLETVDSKCQANEDNCPHKIQLIYAINIKKREIDHLNDKVKALEKSRQHLNEHCNRLEKTVLHLNQVYEKSSLDDIQALVKKYDDNEVPNLELEDVCSDEDSSSHRNRTITLPSPQVLKKRRSSIDMTKILKQDQSQDLPGSPFKHQAPKTPLSVNVLVQTASKVHKNKSIQTTKDLEYRKTQEKLLNLQNDFDKLKEQLKEALNVAHSRAEDILSLNKDKLILEEKILSLRHNLDKSKQQTDHLHNTLHELNRELAEKETLLNLERSKTFNTEQNSNYNKEDNSALLQALKKLEEDKNAIVYEFKDILKKERAEFTDTIKDLNKKLLEAESQLNRKGSNVPSKDAVREVDDKYSFRIVELEDLCFQLRSELDGRKREVLIYQSECDRWKQLASERLSKMEQLTAQLEERHKEEVQSYKAENEHWLSQLNENQRGYLELKQKVAEQKALFTKQITDKDAHIENLRSTIQNLKAQIMNMQTVMSASDPSFDLSAIVEVEADSDGSIQPTERLEIKFDSTTDVNEEMAPSVPCTSTAIWQESVIDRLRREKQMTMKQNGLLRRQVKALAARERRARLEAQNLKNQVYRISTSGSKAITAEAATLQARVAALQTQLTCVRRDTHNSVALWDKWKRAQQSSERWQAKYEERCREVSKLEASLNMARSAVNRLEREKRILVARLAEHRNDKSPNSEKQEHEYPEKCWRESPESVRDEAGVAGGAGGGVSVQALMERIEAQQRRIAALELADKGNEPLTLEYERCLGEVTSLRGQLLRLESALLEAQLRSPPPPPPHHHQQQQDPELHYWKNYCEMLKEENVQLSMKLHSVEVGGGAAGGAGGGGGGGTHQRITDLEQTVLTLRGLVRKLQAESKVPSMQKRPSSSRSSGDKNLGQLESYRIEIANLKRSILDKDNLLERSKEMLRLAAEREEALLRENAFLRHQLMDLKRGKEGFMSA